MLEVNKMMSWSSPDAIPVAWLNALHDIPDWGAIRKALKNGNAKNQPTV